MLEEAVAALKAGKKDALDENLPETNEWSPQINLGLSVLIPESYVSDLGLRLGLYRRSVTRRCRRMGRPRSDT